MDSMGLVIVSNNVFFLYIPLCKVTVMNLLFVAEDKHVSLI